MVLCIVCCEEHIISPLRNEILDCIKDELKLDHYYVKGTNTILVRINNDTLDNSVLRDY